MANWITLSRIPLLILYIFMVYSENRALLIIAVPLLFAFIMMDTLDGWVARSRGQASLIGSVLDIAADRMYELVLWVIFSQMALIPVAIPIIVIIRTTLTDALRSIGVQQGLAPFKQHRSKLGSFLVGSPWMRASYSTFKIISFCGLSLVVALKSYPPGSAVLNASGIWLQVFQITSWIAAAFCVVRGSPVVIGAIRRSLIRPQESS